ncbi:MAG TPA: LamG domain-containing protein [Fimbriimonadaceae bacterium]|nr:LamG domain-containing protein [Fimbriimonadaceae bacterium]
MEKIEAHTTAGLPFAASATLVSPPDPRKSFHFDGRTMPAGGGIGKLGKLTLSMWTKVDNLREQWTALLDTAGWDPGGFHCQYLQDGSLQASFRTQDSAFDGHSSAMPGRSGDWRMVTVTYDTDAGLAAIYVNGVKDTEFEISGGLPADLSNFTLGGWTAGARRFHGRIAAVRLYDRVLSPAEVRDLLAGKAIVQPIAAWDFEPSSEKVVRDSTGHGHDLMVVQ